MALSCVLVVMGSTESFDDNGSIVNTTDAQALYHLGTVALIMTAGLAVMLWLERRGPSRRSRRPSCTGNSGPIDARSGDSEPTGGN